MVVIICITHTIDTLKTYDIYKSNEFAHSRGEKEIVRSSSSLRNNYIAGILFLSPEKGGGLIEPYKCDKCYSDYIFRSFLEGLDLFWHQILTQHAPNTEC